MGAAVRLYKPVAFRVAFPFILLGLGFAIAAEIAVNLVADDNGVTGGSRAGAVVAIRFAQLLAMPLFGSLLAARAAVLMSQALAGTEGQPMEPSQTGRSHLLAGGMLSSFLTFAFTLALGILGAYVGPHLILGPPIFVQILALEKGPFDEAWVRTKAFLKGNAMRVFLYLLCAALALVMVKILFDALIFTVLIQLVGLSTARDPAAFLAGASFGLTLSFMSALGLVAYLELRTRHEEFGIDDLKQP